MSTLRRCSSSFRAARCWYAPTSNAPGAEVTRRGYAWGMVTNGLGLTESRFRSLLDAGLRTVSVSLDGFEREHNYIRCNPSVTNGRSAPCA